MPKVLLVDDEDTFRQSLSRRLKLRGYECIDVSTGEDAIQAIRADAEIDVILLDRKMPVMDGEQVLKEVKAFRPELQVIMLTGHATMDSVLESGRLEAYAYLAKPCELGELIDVINRARDDKIHVMQRHEIPHHPKDSIKSWFKGAHGSRPGIIILGLFVFLTIALTPSPKRLLELVSFTKTEQMSDINLGYASYNKMETGHSITDYYCETYKIGNHTRNDDGRKTWVPLMPEQVARKAKVMLGILVVAALFWATGAVPMGVVALMVGMIMYFSNVLKPDDIAAAYAKDAVIFIFGVLSMALAISKTGLDRRIGMLLMAPARSIPGLLFVVLPLLAITCSFVSEHALIAVVMPLIIVVYVSSIRASGLKKDKNLMVMFVLSMCYAANCGGPGSPAAGGRNAVMMGILADYDLAPAFGEWVLYGLPFVPVMAIVIGGYFYIVFRSRIKVKKLNIAEIVQEASSRIGPMNRNEYITAVALIGVILMWMFASDRYGMGGPVLLFLVFLNVFRIIRWKDITSIPWDVVALYAGACAMGKGLAVTGAALYLADSFVKILPDFLCRGEGLAVATSLFTGLTTNFMSDGATVSAIGPITVPMAMIAGTHPWMIGFATAFASSFAHMLIIGTPNNAIAFALAKDPVTGEQLVTLGDFFKHGAVVLLLSFLVLWGWAFFGYWQFIKF
jgi:sodium-dependent dicarboxylate transporter 2/3/5